MLENLLDTYGDEYVLAAAGLGVGVLFGIGAQASRFCLRAATIEVFQRRPGARMAVWLVVFFAALCLVQLSALFGFLDVSVTRQIAARGSMSGAVIGGLMFGIGMILARGCASRLLVLSGTGNLRALVAGLVVTLIAQASLTGALSPLREAVAGWWIVEGGPQRDVAARLGLSPEAVLGFAVVALMLSIAFAARKRVPVGELIAAVTVAVAVALGWIATYAVSITSFDLVTVSSVTFTGPSTDTLMSLVAAPEIALSFGIGLVPGVFVGSALSALYRREFRVQRFGEDTPIERYLLGGAMMGFGAMLAGGCAVGAGVSGGSIMSLTAWTAVASMWAGAFLAQAIPGVGGRRQPVAP